ncbi:hypothetical protein [Cyclobacterium salsum]|uniref:hypothetical protein n=1 Tax=Cyclobacterium salsum TaxID=2666329 RepID=UPI00293BF18B|nr:hypothetical protein [Cyclobacterium salsum]
MHKFKLYKANGVREYWIIPTETQDLLIYTFTRGKCVPTRLLTSGDVVETNMIMDLEEFFGDIE